jgi:hypothetical protein
MFKQKIISLLILVVLCSVLIPLQRSIVVASPSREGFVTDQFHVNFTGPKAWFVIKANITETSDILFQSTNDESLNVTALSFSRYEIRNETDNTSIEFIMMSGFTPDRYIQTRFGSLNWSYYHNYSVLPSWGRETTTIRAFNQTPGTYYFIVNVYAHDCVLDVWINLTVNATFTINSGTEVFAFRRHDFNGNLNIGGRRGTFILNGEKQVQIHNTLIAEVFVWARTGYYRVSFQPPTGDMEWLSSFDVIGKQVFSRSTDDYWDGLSNGTSGTWTFTVNMINIGIYLTGTPDVLLLGADVKFP